MSLVQSAFAQNTDDVLLPLITITHPTISPPIRVVANTVPIVSRGNEYLDYPFDVVLPDEKDDSPSRAQLVIDNVSREIGLAIRRSTTPATVLIEIIRAAEPDVVERAFPGFLLRNVRINANQVSGDLTLEDFTDEPYPAGIFSPASFPALF